MNLHKPKTAKVLGFFLLLKNKDYLIHNFLFFIFLYFLFSSSLNAQSNISIRGQVKDSERGFPLPNVLIQVDGELFEAYSNQEGYFEIENIPPGYYNFIFILIGYETKTIKNIAVTEDVTAQILIELKAKILQGDSINIEAEQIENSMDIGGNKIVINLEEEKKYGNNNLKKVLQQVAGLEVITSGSGENNTKISIHGSDANQVLVLVDGIRLNNPQTGEADLSEIPFNEVQKIEVIRHGSSAMYGSGAYAGVVNFKTSQKVETAYANIQTRAGSFSTFSGRIGSGAPIGTGFFRANYYQDYSKQNYLYEYENQNLKRKNAWYRNKNYYSKIKYRINSHSFSLGYSQRKTNEGIPSAIFNEQLVYGAEIDEQSRKLFFHYKWLFQPKLYLETISGYNYLNQIFDNSNQPSPYIKYHNNYINSNYDTQIIVNYQFRNLLTSKFGLQYFKESLIQKNILYSMLSAGENERETKSAFVGMEYKLPQDNLFWNSFRLFSAVRYQKYFTQNAGTCPSFGFSMTPKKIESISISSNWAKSVRYPDFNSLFWKGGVQSQGNPDLLPERKTGWNAGFTFNSDKDYFPYIYIFYFSEKLTDLIYWEQTRNNHWEPRNLSDAEKEGWDIQLKQRIYANNISLQAAYSKVNGINKTDEPTIYNKKLVFIPEHTVSASLLANYLKFVLRISCRYVSERQTVKANTADPLDEYGIWDATLNYTEQLGNLFLKLELEAENITGQQYQLLRGYPMPSKIYKTALQIEYKFN